MSEDERLEEMTVAGGWKYLCASLLSMAVHDYVRSKNLWQQTKRMREAGVQAARKLPKTLEEVWLEGGVGIVTYEECCEAIGVQPAWAREKIFQHAWESRRRKPRHAHW